MRQCSDTFKFGNLLLVKTRYLGDRLSLNKCRHFVPKTRSHTTTGLCPVTKNLVRGQKMVLGPFLQQKMVLGPNLPCKIWSMLENLVRLFIDWSAYCFMD